MKYKDLLTTLQTQMRLYGWIEGYISEQESRVAIPIHNAIDKISAFGDFFLKKSSGADRFYDIYATVSGNDIRIGYFGNNGTIRRQAISVCLYKTDEYGELTLDAALYEMAKDKLIKEREEATRSVEKKKTELKIQEEKAFEITKKLNNIETMLGLKENGISEKSEPDRYMNEQYFDYTYETTALTTVRARNEEEAFEKVQSLDNDGWNISEYSSPELIQEEPVEEIKTSPLKEETATTKKRKKTKTI